jgi:hypothetical protein
LRRRDVSHAEPRTVLYYIKCAEAMLKECAFLTPQHRASLTRALEQVKALAPGMDVNKPVAYSDMLKVANLTLLLSVGSAFQSVLVWKDLERGRKARSGEKLRLEAFDAVIAAELLPGVEPKAALPRVNAKLEALGWKGRKGKPPVSSKTLYERQRRIKDSLSNRT